MRPDRISSREDLEVYLSEQCGDLYEHEHLRSQVVDRLALIVEEEAYRCKLLYGEPGWADVIDLCWPDSDVGDKRFFKNVDGILRDLHRHKQTPWNVFRCSNSDPNDCEHMGVYYAASQDAAEQQAQAEYGKETHSMMAEIILPEYHIAFANTNATWDVVETFSAADDAAANKYAEENYADHEDWYVLNSVYLNINAW